MKKLLLVLQILLLPVCTMQGCKVDPTYTCDIDNTKTGYELAADYDDCLVWNAQKKMASIESEDIDIQST